MDKIGYIGEQAIEAVIDKIRAFETSSNMKPAVLLVSSNMVRDFYIALREQLGIRFFDDYYSGEIDRILKLFGLTIAIDLYSKDRINVLPGLSLKNESILRNKQ